MQQVTVTNDNSTEFVMLSVDNIVDAPFSNARKKRDPQAYDDLKNSVARNGFATAVTVRPSKEDGKYELIAGFGRKQVAADLGIELPCVVRDVDDKQAYEIHMSENLDRENLSFIDEIHAAKQFVSYYGGDRASAATRLGWSPKKLAERLELLSCADEVLEALAEELIKPGHALLLAPFATEVQQRTLYKVISENLSVKDLRERARKVQIPLANAKFDTADCIGCPFNSEKQSGLFGSEDDGALCSKPRCYIEKNQVHLAGVVEEQKASHSRVIFMTSSLQHDRVTVSPANVGKAQYDEGCSGCADRAALVDDRPGNEGQVTPSQCLNSECFSKCVATLEKASAEAEVASADNVESTTDQQADKQGASESKATSQKSSPEKAAKVSQKTPERVTETHKKEIRAFAAGHVLKNQSVRMAIMALGVETLFGKNSSSRPEARIRELLALSDSEIKGEISSSLDAGINSATSASSTPMYEFLASILSCVEGGNDAAIASWKPTKENLDPYYVQGLQGIVSASGVSDSLAKGAAQGRKGAVIEAIVSADFDWTGYAPAPFIKLLK